MLAWLGLGLHVAGATSAAEPAADLILLDARIYTAASPERAQALAVRGDRLLYVGTNMGALDYRGPHTRIRHLQGRLILPGLIDSHIHPIDIVELDACDLKNQVSSLSQIAAFVRRCIRHYHLKPGEWLAVHQWNFSDGNAPEAQLPTLRSALDLGGPDNPVELLGNDGHEAAFNSRALALARNGAGEVVGFSRRTLAAEFAALRPYVSADANDEPDGVLIDDARVPIDPARMQYNDLDLMLKHPERMTAQLNSAGITAVLDASVAPEGLAAYDALLAGSHMTVRANLALHLDPNRYRDGAGQIDFQRIVRQASDIRDRYHSNELVHADFFKVFGDGVIEGNPFSKPPKLGDALLLRPYLQPMFALDGTGHATVTGYVDQSSAVCADVRAQAGRYQAEAARQAFARDNGFFPSQCLPWSGRLTVQRDELFELFRQLHLAHFNLHVHVIGDGTTRAVVDAIEAARAADGNDTTHDSLAHLQLADPDDLRRIGRDRLYVAFTYSWAIAEQDYDMTVVPFVQKVHGNSYDALHGPDSFYDAHAYPFRASRDAGALLVAGSDAPVVTRDPRPFVNMAVALTRRTRDGRPISPEQSLTIREVLEAYTIEGARFLGRDSEIGSLEAGKSADFVLLDRDILALADTGHADEVADTCVLETWFRGRRVYRARPQ
jgi:predicted amidohydrolase YtcJ